MILSSLMLLSLVPDAAAEDKVKRFSVDLSAGVRPDMASLGDTIVQDGTVDTADTTVASLLYSTDKALMSDRSNMVLWNSSNSTDTIFKVMGEEPVLGGALLGLELGGRLRYELDDVINFPLFVQSGFHYTYSASGGYQERVLGDIASENEEIALLFQANGLDPDDYTGGKMITEYSASWFEIPLSLGIKVPVKREYTFGYGTIGASFFSGGFSVMMDVDEKYANALATHADLDSDELVPPATNYSPGAVQDTVSFLNAGIGMNYGVGVQVGMKNGAAFFIEYNGSGTSATVYSSDMKQETQELLTATSSETIYGADPAWFEKLAFPVVTAGATARVGVRYYLF